MAGLSIGEVSRRTGLSVDALRFYEREGVLAGRVPRDGAGRRVYGDDAVAWLRICQTLRASGMPLDAIREYAELVRQGPGNEERRLAILRAHQQRVAEQLAALTECQELIDHKVQVYESRLADGTASRLWAPLAPG
jgi:DNA-binding transcriptional MerR regulator